MRRVRTYETFKDMIEDVGIKNLLPDHAGNIDAAVRVYKSFGTTRGSYAELEKEYGAVAIDIEPVEPCTTDLDEVIPAISTSYETDDDATPSSAPSTIY